MKLIWKMGLGYWKSQKPIRQTKLVLPGNLGTHAVLWPEHNHLLAGYSAIFKLSPFGRVVTFYVLGFKKWKFLYY